MAIDPNIVIVIAVVAIVLLIGVAIWYGRKRRSDQLSYRFGPEYERTLEETGDRRKAEANLAEREKRVRALSIRPLEAKERDRYNALWRKVQANFVDDPSGAISQADSLLGEVMTARGYPVSDFDQAAEDLSVDHALVVQHYRAGHEVAVQHEHGKADTEALRRAMIHYRELFGELVEETPADESRQERKESVQ
jgi:FtsZ-interacting cell division protein ZipA